MVYGVDQSLTTKRVNHLEIFAGPKRVKPDLEDENENPESIGQQTKGKNVRMTKTSPAIYYAVGWHGRFDRDTTNQIGTVCLIFRPTCGVL